MIFTFLSVFFALISFLLIITFILSSKSLSDCSDTVAIVLVAVIFLLASLYCGEKAENSTVSSETAFETIGEVQEVEQRK